MDRYLTYGNLHSKPLSAHLSKALLWSSVELRHHASPTRWHGHIIRVVSRAIPFLGMFFVIPIGLIETTSLFAIAGVGTIMNALFYSHRSPILQKHSLKALSHALHSFAITALFCTFNLKNKSIPNHTTNVLIDRMLHVGAAALIQCSVGANLDKRAKRTPQEALLRTLYLLQENLPAFLNDVLTQIYRDFNVDLRGNVREFPQVQEYLNQNPDAQTFLDHFDPQATLREPADRERIIQFFRHFLIRTTLSSQAQNNDRRFELNRPTAAEAEYQKHLCSCLKEAVSEIYRTPALCDCLKTLTDSGKELLEANFVWPQVILYAQYKELLKPIACPTQFTGNLTEYTPRRALLSEAREKLLKLSPEQHTLLAQKLLKGDAITLPPAVQKSFLEISDLSKPFTQGPLTTNVAIDLTAPETGNVLDIQNIFQKAYGEAIEENSKIQSTS